MSYEKSNNASEALSPPATLSPEASALVVSSTTAFAPLAEKIGEVKQITMGIQGQVTDGPNGRIRQFYPLGDS